MKDTVLPVAFVIVALIAGMWYYVSVSAQRDANARALSMSASAPAPSPPIKKNPPAIRRISKPIPIPETAADSQPAPVEVAKSELRAFPKLVPTGALSDIKPGMEANEVIELLGEPDLTAVTTDRGSLLVTYVYDRMPGDRISMIHLRGGRVAVR